MEVYQAISSKWNTALIGGSILIGFFIIQFVIKVIKYILYIREVSQVVNKLPGIPGHWFWGHIFLFPGPGEKGIAWSMDLLKKFPKYNRFYAGWWRPSVAVKHPDCIKAVLKTTEPKAMGGGGGYRLLLPWLGEGLLVSSGQKWFRNRKLLTPGFHFDVLKPYMEIYHQAASTLISKWDNATDESVEIFRPVSLCTLDVMLRCAFTFESDIQKKDNRYVSTVNSIASLIIDRAFKPWMYLDFLYYRSPNGKRFKELCDYAHKVANDLIYTRRASLKEKKEETAKKYVDFLDILLLAKDENGNGLTDDEIRQEVDTFLFEGHDTTASAISWILYALAKHPAIQKQCQEEIDGLFEDPDNPYVSWDNLQEIPNLTKCIKEGLRMYSPVPMVMRELKSPLKLDDEHTLLPGTSINVNIFNLHHNATVWGDDHDEFKPERFDPDKIQEMDSHAFLPFSAGPRNCIGQNFAMHEIKVIVARVLQHFDLSVDESHPVERLPLMTMRAKYGLKLNFKPRREN